MPDSQTPKFEFDKLVSFTTLAYEAAGVPPDEAAVVADLLVRSDLRGIGSTA